MSNIEIIKYIKNATEQGQDLAQIRVALTQNGWAVQDITEAIVQSGVTQNQTEVPQMPQQESPLPDQKLPTATFSQPKPSSKKRTYYIVALSIALAIILLGGGVFTYFTIPTPKQKTFGQQTTVMPSTKQTVEQQTTLPTTKHEVTKQQTLPSDKQTIKQQYSQVCTPPAKLCIISPKNGTVVVPGETVSVVINLASGVTYPNGVTVAGGGTAAGSILTTPPFHFNYTVPNDAPVGKLHLTAMGSSKPQQVELSAPITLYVERPDTPTVLSVVPFHIQFSAPGDQQRLDIEGTFPNGNVLPLNHSSLTTISSTNPTVAYVDNRGFVTAMSAGNATIIIKYRDKEVNVRVNVPHTIPGDLNGDGIVDQEDINLVLAALGYSADKPFDARDINNDGVINMLDVKKLTLLCTYSHCASQ